MDLAEARARTDQSAARHPWEKARLVVVSRLLSQHAALEPGTVVLDIGCGDTYVVERLARDNPALQFYAVDTAFTDELIVDLQTRMQVRNVRLFHSLDHLPQPIGQTVSAVLLMDVV